MATPTATLPIRETIVATPRSRIVRLDTRGVPLGFRAGQSVLLGAHGQPMRKPYSVACAPEETVRHGWLELLIQLQDDGVPGPHLPDLTPGALLDTVGPVGTFTYPDEPDERYVLFIAGGAGIAPLRSMLQHVLLGPRPTRPAYIGLMYSARTPEEFAYLGELQALARDGALDLKLTVTRGQHDTWLGGRGRIDRRQLEPMVRDAATLCFICGPPSLLLEMPPLLAEFGVDRNRIKMEEWEV